MNSEHAFNYANLDPWIGNVIDLTLADGTHRIGLLRKVDAQWAQLDAGRGNPALLDAGKVLISDAVSVVRASRN